MVWPDGCAGAPGSARVERGGALAAAGGGAVSESDLAALPLFLQLRHLWNLGEAAGRLHHWGTNAVPLDWLEKQVAVLEAWKGLDLRA